MLLFFQPYQKTALGFYLMFLAGMEVKLKQITNSPKGVVKRAVMFIVFMEIFFPDSRKDALKKNDGFHVGNVYGNLLTECQICR